MKHYTNVKLFTQRHSDFKYILEVSVIGGEYATEYYEFVTKAEAKKARAIVLWMISHPYCKADFEGMMGYSQSQMLTTMVALNGMHLATKTIKWALN